MSWHHSPCAIVHENNRLGLLGSIYPNLSSYSLPNLYMSMGEGIWDNLKALTWLLPENPSSLLIAMVKDFWSHYLECGLQTLPHCNGQVNDHFRSVEFMEHTVFSSTILNDWKKKRPLNLGPLGVIKPTIGWHTTPFSKTLEILFLLASRIIHPLVPWEHASGPFGVIDLLQTWQHSFHTNCMRKHYLDSSTQLLFGRLLSLLIGKWTGVCIQLMSNGVMEHFGPLETLTWL